MGIRQQGCTIDGETIPGDPARGEGTATNQLGLLDPLGDGIVGYQNNSGSPNRNIQGVAKRRSLDLKIKDHDRLYELIVSYLQLLTVENVSYLKHLLMLKKYLKI